MSQYPVASKHQGIQGKEVIADPKEVSLLGAPGPSDLKPDLGPSDLKPKDPEPGASIIDKLHAFWLEALGSCYSKPEAGVSTINNLLKMINEAFAAGSEGSEDSETFGE